MLIYATIPHFGIGKIFHQGCIYMTKKYHKNSNICIIAVYNKFIPVM